MSTPMSTSGQNHTTAPADAHQAGWASFTKFATYATIIVIAILIVLAAVFVHRTTGAAPTA